MKLFVGVTGEICGGKGTAIHYIASSLETHGVTSEVFSTSDKISVILRLLGVTETRKDKQQLPIALNAWRQGAVTHAVKTDIEKSDADIKFFDSLRLPSDLEYAQSFGVKCFILYVTAFQDIRCGRYVRRNQYPGDREIILEQFKEIERRETERHIHEFAMKADATVFNNLSKSEFLDSLDEVTGRLILPRIGLPALA